MTQHRAWRVQIEHTSNRACVNAATIRFYETKNGPDVTQGAPGAAFASSSDYGAASQAFDNNDGTLWHDGCGNNGNAYVGWDFGGDTSAWKDVKGFYYRARGDDYSNQDSLRSGGLEWSDDMTTWTRLFNVEQTDAWNSTNYAQKYFWGKLPDLQDAGGFRYFKIESTSNYSSNNSYNGFSKVELYNQSGVNVAQNLNDSTNPLRSLYGTTPQDGSVFAVTTTMGSVGDYIVQFNSPPLGQFIILDLGNENKSVVTKARMYPNRDAVDRTWQNIRISGSNDATAWTVLTDWTANPWQAATWQETTFAAFNAAADNAPHRYWRLYNSITTGNPLAMAGLTFTDATRTPFQNGTYAASATYVGNNGDPINYSVSNLGDGSSTTIWAGPTTREWVSIDYGTPVNPTYVQVTARGDGDTNAAKQAPDTFIIQYSDDGVTWITKSKIDGFDKWGIGETRTFDLVFDSYKIGWETSQNNQNVNYYVSMSDIGWIDSATGNEYSTPPYNPATMTYSYGASYNYYNSSNVTGLFDRTLGDNDGNSSFFWYGSTADDRFFVQRFPKGQAMSGLEVWSRSDLGSLQAQSPIRFRITKSTDNGLTYTHVARNNFANFGAEYQKQTVLYAPLALPPKKDRYRLRTIDTNGSGYNSIDEIEWHNSVGGTQAATGGTVYETGTLNGYPGSNAYDGVTTSTGNDAWVGVGAGSALGYIWPDAIEIAEYSIYGRVSYPDQLPRSWVIEYSTDGGVTWVIVDRRYGQMGWQEGVAKTYQIIQPSTSTHAHRYWRLLFDPLGQYIGMRRLKFYDETGTDVTPVGTLSVVGSLGTTAGTLNNLLYDDDSEFVYNGVGISTSLVFDYGANPREIASFRIWSRTGYSGNDCPKIWNLQYSDDIVTWTSVSRYDGQDNWADYTDRTYPRDFTGYRILITGTGASGYLGIPEVDFLTGGVSQIVPTDLWRVSGTLQYSGSLVGYAFDGNTGTMYYVQSSNFDAGNPPYLGYRLPLGTTIDAMKITPRQDGYANNDSPSEFTIQKSDDNGLTWHAQSYALNLYPWDATPRTYTVTATPTGFARAGRSGLYEADGPQSGTHQVYRLGLYEADGPETASLSVHRAGMYVVDGPVNEEDDGDKPLYRPRQFFIN